MANLYIREIKLGVTWSYVKRQTATMTSEFAFFSSNPSLNHIKIEKCLLLFATNTNISTIVFKELKTVGKSFIFAVCRLTEHHVTSSLNSLLSTPLIKPNYVVILPPTQHRSSFRNLPPFSIFYVLLFKRRQNVQKLNNFNYST